MTVADIFNEFYLRMDEVLFITNYSILANDLYATPLKTVAIPHPV